MINVTIGHDGLGRAQNPYNMYEGNLNPSWLDFDKTHPALPVISPTGEAVTEPGSYEVEVKWQYQHPVIKDCSDCNGQDYYKTHRSRQVYRILPQPKEASEFAVPVDLNVTYGPGADSCEKVVAKSTEKTLTANNFFELATFSSVTEVNSYYKSIKKFHHDSNIVKAIEDFANWKKAQPNLIEEANRKVSLADLENYLYEKYDIELAYDEHPSDLLNGSLNKSTHIEKSKVLELVEKIKMNMELTGYDRGVNDACNFILTELQKL